MGGCSNGGLEDIVFVFFIFFLGWGGGGGGVTVGPNVIGRFI